MKISGLKIENAYKTTGLTPVVGRMFSTIGETKCACAMGVLYVEENGVPKKEGDIWKWAENKFGRSFMDGFWQGFDGVNFDDSYEGFVDEAFKEGYQNGRYIRNYIHPKFPRDIRNLNKENNGSSTNKS